MFAKNVFGSHLESIICKTINVRVRASRASPAGRLHPDHTPSPYFIGGGGVGVRGAMRKGRYICNNSCHLK